MKQYNILLVHIDHRLESSALVQSILSKYGCSIKVRVGLHETASSCAEDGLIVLQMDNDEDAAKALQTALNDLDSVNAKLIQMP